MAFAPAHNLTLRRKPAAMSAALPLFPPACAPPTPASTFGRP